MTKLLNDNLQTRPPVVVIMGHIDHGKTTLLDTMRKTKVAEKEAGGITQSIGAYQVEHQGKTITFIDTPGHEAFHAMRSRGAKVADIAVLVVAADDGVMPQTKEAIGHIKHAGIPMIVAINKVDKPNANVMRVKNQLLEEEIVVEDFKGKVPSVEVSAKTGQGMEGLLEIINLVAEVEELGADIATPAEGVVIEAELDHRRGPAATLLVKSGILRRNDVIVLSSTFGRAKIMEDFRGKDLEEVPPATPARVIGLTDVPLVGDTFHVASSVEEAEQKVDKEEKKYGRETVEVLEAADNVKILNIVLKADAQGTLEAAREVLRGIQNESITLRFLEKSVGEIMERDIKLAAAARALIIGFRTRISPSAEQFAQQMKVEVLLGNVIYDLVEQVRGKIGELLSGERKEVEFGTLKVLAIFLTEKNRMIVGGKVTSGEMRRGAKIQVLRPARHSLRPPATQAGERAGEGVAGGGEEVIGEGRAAQLKIRDKAVESVAKDQECGVLFEGPVRILVGDILRAHGVVEQNVEL